MPASTESCSEQVLIIYHHHHLSIIIINLVLLVLHLWSLLLLQLLFFLSIWSVFQRKKERQTEMGFVHNPWNTDFKSSTPRVILCTTDEIQTRQIALKTKQNDWEFIAPLRPSWRAPSQARFFFFFVFFWRQRRRLCSSFLPPSSLRGFCFFSVCPTSPGERKLFIEEIIRVLLFLFQFFIYKNFPILNPKKKPSPPSTPQFSKDDLGMRLFDFPFNLFFNLKKKNLR
jgi:hypothetical protein